MDEESDNDDINANVKYNPKVDKGKSVNIVLGKEYPDHIVFREQLRQYALVKGFDYLLPKNDKTRVTAICKENKICKWRIHASWNIRETAFVVKTFQPEHTCSVQFHNSKVTAKWIANEFFEHISDNPEVSDQTLQKLVKRTYNVHASEQQCYRAKKFVQRKLYGDEVEQYKKLADYCEAIKQFNPGSTALIIIDGDDKFMRIYICLEACKRGFKNGCQPLIGLDACHLKVYQTSQLLAAIGIDANDNIFSIAYAVCETENGDTWKWFLENLLKDIGDWENNKWVFMSDQQKGLDGALEALMPGVEHRYCVRHLYNNFKKLFQGEIFKNCMWAAATSTTRQRYQLAMQEIEKLCPEAANWLYRIPVQKWCRHAFSVRSRCVLLLNNLSESFNAYIRKAREKPIVVLLETIRRLLMKRFNAKREGIRNHTREVCPRILKHLAKNREYERDYTIRLANVGEFEVEHMSGFTNVVNLKNATCTCNGWQLTGIPCTHACAAIVANHQEPKDYVMNCYSKSTFMNIYASGVHGVPSSDYWPKSQLVVNPPVWKRQSGRRKKRRNKEEGESTSSRSRRQSLRCRRCGQWGHNVRTCKGPTKPRKKVRRSGDNITIIDLGDGRKQAIRINDETRTHSSQAQASGSKPQVHQPRQQQQPPLNRET